MQFWKTPLKIKVYEALGTIGDERIELHEEGAHVYSSNGNKYYTITYNQETHAIMCNDNASYWNGTLGYPAIAFLMLKGLLPYTQVSRRTQRYQMERHQPKIQQQLG